MEISHIQKQPWWTIAVGLASLAVTIIYYESIVHSSQVDHAEIDIFEIYGWAVVLFGFALTVWAFLKIKRLTKLWLLGLIFLANVFVFYYAFGQVKPLPYQIKFAITNKTNSELTQIKVLGNRELKFDNLKPNATVNFIYSDYEENSSIELVCNYKNKTDAVYLAGGMTSGISEQFRIILIDENKKLVANRN
jgi:hypothetical protein